MKESPKTGGGDADCLYYEDDGNDCIFCAQDEYLKWNGDCANDSKCLGVTGRHGQLVLVDH